MERKIDPKVLDTVSAIWMLACNDADPIITYRGIANRVLESDVKHDKELVEKAKNLVKDWPELFSPVVAKNWFEEWQQDWVIRKGHYPRWVLELWPDPKTDEITRKRCGEIENLRREDVFRSQFRTEQTREVSTTEQVKLGLEHLDRLRKAGMEVQEERLKRTTGFWLPALALGVTAIATLGGFYINSQSLENSRQSARQTAGLTAADAEIRLWDLASRERGDAYESSLDAMQLAFDAAAHGDEAEAQKQLIRIRVNLFRLEPLIDKQSRKQLWNDYENFKEFCSDRLVASRQASAPEQAKAAREQFDNLRNGMHERLYHLLFEKGPNEFDPQKPLRDVFQ